MGPGLDAAGIDALQEQISHLEEKMGGAAAMTGAFTSELARMQATVVDTQSDVRVLTGGISRGLRRAFDGLVFDGAKLSDALRGVGQAMADSAYGAAIRPVTKHFGGLLAQGIESLTAGLLPMAKGGAFVDGQVMPFARGGVVSRPTTFAMRGGAGLMGEAGPEAIMPLARGNDGRLGVRSHGGRPVQVTVNVQTPDVGGFRRSQSQIAAELGRAIQRGNRNR